MSALRFSEKYSDDTRVPALLTTATEELFSLKQYDKAEYAARLILKMGVKIGIYSSVYEWGQVVGDWDALSRYPIWFINLNLFSY